MSIDKMDLVEEVGRVLSIQSHVVSGYVGNKSATFPLQVLGFEVDAINSVQFSNHTGYEYFKGQVLNSAELDELMAGLRLNNIHHYSHLLTGYVGDASFLHKVVDFAKELKDVNPNLTYVCDPVLGDNGQLYVPASLLPIYRNHVVPIANIITPNQFEAELLTDMAVKDEESALSVMKALHDLGPTTVVLSSLDFGNSDKLFSYASSLTGNGLSFVRIDIPKLSGTFTGTGDLFSACFLAWYSKTKGDLKVTMEKCVGTLQDVLKRTERVAQRKMALNKTPSVFHMELQIIQSKSDIEHPKSIVEAKMIV